MKSSKKSGYASPLLGALVTIGLLAGCGVPTSPADVDQSTPATPTAEATPVLATPSAPETTPSSPETTPAATPTPTPEPTEEPDGPGRIDADDDSAYDTALEGALALVVKGRAPKTGYERKQFGSGWVDVDRNGCDTRNDMLNLRLTDREMSGTCKVLAGTLADPFTATDIRFEYGGPSEVDIDHLVALSDAWQKGAAQWEFAKRVAFANDPLNLEPVDSGANRQKGDSDAATWLPANKAYRCHYVARQVAVKTKYEVWTTQAEVDAILGVLEGCPSEPMPSAGDQPVLAENTGGSEPAKKESVKVKKPAKAKKAPKSESKPKPDLDPRYPYCKDLPAELGPYLRGVDPEYDWYRDGDKDGIVCEGRR